MSTLGTSCNPKRLLQLAVFGLGILWFPLSALGDAIWLSGQKDPIFGRLNESQSTPQNVVFSKTTNGVDFEEITIDRSQIKALIISVDATKLQSLAPDDPESWFDFAEELSTQKQDPVARKLAIRLYLVAAKHSRGKLLRDAAIQNLIPLARSEQESQRFKRFSWLETGGPSPQARALDDSTRLQLSPQQKKLALEITQAIRQGNGNSIANRWNQLEGSISNPTTGQMKAMSSAKKLTVQQLNQLVALEYRLRNPQLSTAGTNSSWLEMRSAIQKVELDFPTLDNVTEMDPTKTQFQNGKWINR